MFQIPTVLLCSADCAGLCPVCGKKKAEDGKYDWEHYYLTGADYAR
jgi:uncharacterized metal-binding protein YceD (DUF177 family)